MAKRIGRRATKKGLDQRDIIVIVCYVLLFVILFVLFLTTKSGQKDVALLQVEEQNVIKEIQGIEAQFRNIDMELRKNKAALENSRANVEKERADYSIVVGTSLEYAKKNRLLTAIWDAISKVRGLALTKVQIAKNDVNVEVLAQTDTVITEFVAEMNKRKDLIDSIQPGQIQRDRGAKGASEQYLVGEVKIIARRPDNVVKGASPQGSEQVVESGKAPSGAAPRRAPSRQKL